MNATQSVDLHDVDANYASVETTMIYTHVIRGLESTAQSPLDALGVVT